MSTIKCETFYRFRAEMVNEHRSMAGDYCCNSRLDEFIDRNSLSCCRIQQCVNTIGELQRMASSPSTRQRVQKWPIWQQR